MIKITKPKQAPAILEVDGNPKCAVHSSDYHLHKAEYDIGKRKFRFDAGIYGDATVKDALITAQYSKCCFCESKVGNDGDVEHFRPKGGYRQTASGRLLRPGYYWLAYDWNNLLLSCSACNQRHKRSHFPLVDPAQRANSHTADVTLEAPLILHPVQQDPELFIGFRKEIPFAINGNRSGKATIKILGLNREILNERRRERLAELVGLRQVVDLIASKLSTDAEGIQLMESAKARLAEAVTYAGEFASMARAAAKNDFYLSWP